MLDAIQAPSTDLVSRINNEWKFSDSSSRVVADVAQSSSSSNEIVPYFFDSADQVTMLKTSSIKTTTTRTCFLRCYEFLKNFSSDLDPEISSSAITSEASTYVKSTLQKLNVSTLLKSLTEGKDVFGANSVLPYRMYDLVCARVQTTPTLQRLQVQSLYGYFNLYLQTWTKSSSDNVRRRKRTCHVVAHFKPCRGRRRVNVTSKFWNSETR